MKFWKADSDIKQLVCMPYLFVIMQNVKHIQNRDNGLMNTLTKF